MSVDKWFLNGKFIADRIIVIGAPGSGKTYLTERLAPYFDGAVIHIDQILWEDNKIPLSDEELHTRLEKIIKEKKWFIDGTYLRMLSERISRALLIIFLDLPNEECIRGINERRLKTGIVHECEDYEGFINYVSKYDITNRPQIEKMINSANADVIIMKSREEVNSFLEDCKICNMESEKLQNVYQIDGENVDFSVVNKKAWDYKSYEYWKLKYGKPQKLGHEIAANPQLFLKKYLKYFRSFENESILNICGSNGKLAVACACKGAKVTVIDISKDGKRYAEEVAKAAGTNISYVLTDFFSYDSKEEYDVAFSYIGVLHFFSSIHAFFEKVYSLVKEGGYFIFSDFHPFLKIMYSEKERLQGDYFDSTPFYGDMPYAKYFDISEEYPPCIYREYTMSEIVNALVENGFEIEHFSEIPFKSEKYPCEFIIKACK